ncbi:hypothetical protein ASPSYDRAFT_124322, partial [Aspergillus sydowii CBS 593.65]
MEDEQYDLPKVIPAYYCCYLLRSLGTGYKGSALYIGSTPDPARRLAQHNGLSKGGARKTANDKRRPWEIVMVVEGFTSNIGALQFEWAWQHPAATRHLTSKVSDENGELKGKGDIDNDTVKSKRKPPLRRTRHSLKAHLEDLHLLLRSTYFKDWPLTLRFFAADVSQAWRGWCDRVDGIIPDHIKIITDGNCTGIFAGREERNLAVGSVQDINVDYTPIREYVEKGMLLLDDIRSSNCKVCEAQYKENDLAVVCPTAGCNSTAHLLCLSTKFLDTAKDSSRFVPLAGKCPMCAQTVQWSFMMQELSIRIRGRDMTHAILNRCEKKRRKALKITEDKAATVEKPTAAATMERDSSDGDGNDTDSLDDYWDKVLDSDLESGGNSSPQKGSKVSKVEVVIEDSELDDDEPL